VTTATPKSPAATNGWQTVALGSLADYINGRAFKPAEWETEGLPIIRIQNLTNPAAPANHFAGELADRHRVVDGDLLVSWSASLDTFLWDRGPAALNQHIFKVQERPSVVDRQFLFFVLKAAMAGIRAQVHGSTMQHITKPKFEGTRVKIPASLNTQCKIAEQLTERLRGVADIQSAARRQQEAVRASSGAIIRRALDVAHKGSQVEEVPLASVLELTQYGSSEASNREGHGVPMLRMGNIADGELLLEDLVHVELPPEHVSKYRLKRGDVLINRTNSAELVGKSALFDREDHYVFASYLIRVHPHEDRCLPEYLQAVWSSSIGARYIDKTKHQSVGQANINATEIKAMPFPLPGLKEQRVVLKTLEGAAPVLERMSRAAQDTVASADLLEDAVLREIFEPEVPHEPEDQDG
jgi:type I restriction enzyme S subunit